MVRGDFSNLWGWKGSLCLTGSPRWTISVVFGHCGLWLISVLHFPQAPLAPRMANAETGATSAQTSTSPVAMTAVTQPPQQV